MVTPNFFQAAPKRAGPHVKFLTGRDVARWARGGRHCGRRSVGQAARSRPNAVRS